MEGMMSKWQIGPVKLANGEEAFIDAINEGQEDYRYTGRVCNQAGHWIACGWHANGRYMYAHTDHGLNLAPPPKKTLRVQRCLAIHHNGMTSTYADRQNATAVEKDIFALIEIDREVTEGEGL
jgi:hypothetical protein